MGVSWHKQAQKWTARIRTNEGYRYLGLFETTEAASAAYRHAKDERERDRIRPDYSEVALLQRASELYRVHGIQALATPFLEKDGLYHRLLNAKLPQPVLLEKLGLTAEFAAWRKAARKYRGTVKPTWTWEIAVETAIALKEREGDLPTVEWCRRNGYSQLTNAVHRSGRKWDELRQAVGCVGTSSGFYESRNGMRWRSRPEASLSNFLYARGIEHKRGERYANDYSEQSGRAWGYLDLHFLSKKGVWIDVEVWGDPENNISGTRYQTIRAHKERYQANNPNFLGIEYRDCLSDVRLTKILAAHIGIIEPFRFEKPQDRIIQTSHWSDADELLVECKKFAEQMPDGIFPSEDWLRKRGKYATRPGPTYNTLAIRVNQWLGGTRSVRELLGHGHASTTRWTKEGVIAAWRSFHEKHGVTPSQVKGKFGKLNVSNEIAKEGAKIYEVARRLGLRAEARGGVTARKRVWSPEKAVGAWHEFERAHGVKPSQALSAFRRLTLPRDTVAEAIRIYAAIRSLACSTWSEADDSTMQRIIRVITVRAHLDSESRTWWTDGEDVPGLCCQGQTFEELVEAVSDLAPNLLVANGAVHEREQVEIVLV